MKRGKGSNATIIQPGVHGKKHYTKEACASPAVQQHHARAEGLHHTVAVPWRRFDRTFCKHYTPL